MIDTRTFLESVSGYNGSPKTSANKPVKLGTIDAGYVSGLPSILFDGDTVPSIRGYAWVDPYVPKAGDRVALVPVGTTYLIVGKVQTSIPVVPPPGPVASMQVLSPLAPANWGVGGDVYIDTYGTIQRASLTIKVTRTGGAFSMPTGSYTTIGQVVPPAALSATGVQAYSSGYLNGGSTPIGATIFLNPSSGLLLVQPESTVTVGTNWVFTFGHTWTI